MRQAFVGSFRESKWNEHVRPSYVTMENDEISVTLSKPDASEIDLTVLQGKRVIIFIEVLGE